MTAGPAPRAVLLLLAVLHLDAQRQQRLLLEYADRHGYRLAAVAFDRGAALALLHDHLAEVIVAVFEVPDVQGLGTLAEAEGGRLEYVRPPRLRPPAQPLDLVVQMYRRGAEPALVARLLDLPLTEVRRRLGADLREGYRRDRAVAR